MAPISYTALGCSEHMHDMPVDTALERVEDFEPETKTRSRVVRATFALVAACALAAVVAFAHPATRAPAASTTIEANAQVFSITKCATCRFEAGQTLMVETFSCSSCAGEEKFGKMWSDVSLGGDCSCSKCTKLGDEISCFSCADACERESMYLNVLFESE